MELGVWYGLGSMIGRQGDYRAFVKSLHKVSTLVTGWHSHEAKRPSSCLLTTDGAKTLRPITGRRGPSKSFHSKAAPVVSTVALPPQPDPTTLTSSLESLVPPSLPISTDQPPPPRILVARAKSKTIFYLRCETLQVIEETLLQTLGSKESYSGIEAFLIPRKPSMYEVQIPSSSPAWRSAKTLFRLASLTKRLFKDYSRNYDDWFALDMDTTLHLPGPYFAITEEADLPDSRLRQLFATHSLVVIARSSSLPSRPLPLDVATVQYSLRTNPRTVVDVQSKFRMHLSCKHKR